jgi:hypothetical protein
VKQALEICLLLGFAASSGPVIKDELTRMWKKMAVAY